MQPSFPFSAIVGQDDLKLALMIAAVDRHVGGVLAFGDRGTGKSTAIRALAALLPTLAADEGDALAELDGADVASSAKSGKARPAPVVDLPLGATEDRVIGALDLEAALLNGERKFQPGLLARAHRGFLYIDEVNLLDDHLVDVLLDVAASGENVVEREGLSVRHPAQFVLVGSGNPEEGELRPQLLDRFGMAVDVRTPVDVKERIEVVRRRDAFERDPDGFIKKWKRKDAAVRKKIDAARTALDSVATDDAALESAAAICIALGTDGLRGELTLMRAARAYAALQGDAAVAEKHLKKVAPFALRHRLRKDPLDETDAAARVERALGEVFSG
ncbi:MAG: ATP-binding protein [Pseudomonadota bacterium]